MTVQEARLISRRGLIGSSALLAATMLGGRTLAAPGLAPAGQLAASLAIDLTGEPPTLDPAKVYDVDSWSVIHSIYDALVQLGPGGALDLVLAESLEQVDPLMWEVKLRPNVTFHNGEPLESSAITFAVAHIVDPATASQVAGNFTVIESVEEVDALTARLHLSAPAPWLPSQLAPWLAMLPPKYAGDPANDFANNPIGTGPYKFVSWERGAKVSLERNADYFGGGAKGVPIAEKVDIRFVLDGTTRATDLISGTSQIVAGVPFDQLEAVEAVAAIVAETIAGCAFIRLPNDVEPFKDPRVRLAMNHAVDVDAIIASLIGGHGQRLANFFVPDGLGYDPDLAPHAFDPELAKSLLAEAGYPDGFTTTLAVSSIDRNDLATAIAGQLTAVGIKTDVQPVEISTFNSQWKDPDAAPLRMASWRPMVDPFTLLNLLVSSSGFLSRFNDPDAQPLIEAGASETDPVKRNEIYQQLGRVLHDSPAGIYLWNRVSFFGVADAAPAWTPRPDDWILPLVVND